MKKSLLFSLLFLVATGLFAQGVSPYSVRNIRFGFEVTSDIWLNTPAELELKNINRGANIALMYYNRFGESKFGVSSGLVLATQNMYSKNAVLQKDEDGESFFNPILDTVPFSRNKINMNYLELPLEFSFKTKGHLTFALGAKAGYLISDKTKYSGKDYMHDISSDIRVKVQGIDNIMNYRLGTYAVIGYKWINLTAYYGLTSLFEKDLGPQMNPLTIGVMVRPY